MPYVFRTIAVASIYLTVHFLVCLFLPSPIAAEYWIRELIVVKQMLAGSIGFSPRIIFLGGSSTLFGIDAQVVATETGLPAMNMGLQAEMRLDRLLSVGEAMVRRGDVLVLPLEQGLYSCDKQAWDDWQLRNALAWDRSYFNSLSLSTRMKAIFYAGGTYLMLDVLTSKLESIAAPKEYAARLEALAPAEVIWARYRSGKLRTSDFSYSAYNIDDRGDMLENEGANYSGPGVPANEPSNVCSETLSTLINLVARMKHKEVRVLVAHAPYLIEGTPSPDWKDAEQNFLRDIAFSGAEVLDHKRNYSFHARIFSTRPSTLMT